MAWRRTQDCYAPTLPCARRSQGRRTCPGGRAEAAFTATSTGMATPTPSASGTRRRVARVAASFLWSRLTRACSQRACRSGTSRQTERSGTGRSPSLSNPRVYQDELGLFGTIGTGDTNVRCARGGPMVLLSRGPTSASGRRWFVSRSEYRLIKDHLSRVRSRTVRSTMRNVNALAHRWGMDALPFAGCTVARGRRL